MTRAILVGISVLSVGSPLAAASHDVDVTSVARVFLDQIGERRYVFSVVDTKVPSIVGRAGVLPTGCVPLPQELAGVRVVAGFAFECDDELNFDDGMDLPWPLAGVVVLATWSDGTEASAYFRGNGRSVPILLGDLNTVAPTGETYRLLRAVGYGDAWTRNLLVSEGSGFTCCHDADLRNEEVKLDRRIDLVMVRNVGGFLRGRRGRRIGPVFAFVVGDELDDRTPSGLWPSDHAGVVAQLKIPVLPRLLAGGP